MKINWIYTILFVFEITLALTYGLFFQNYMLDNFFFISAIIVPFTVLLISSKEETSMSTKCEKALILSLALMVIFVISFDGLNKLNGEFIDEYDVIVEEVTFRDGGQATFTTPQGIKGRVNLHDYRPIVEDENDCVNVGDFIRVQEYKGIFNQSYFVLVDKKQ